MSYFFFTRNSPTSFSPGDIPGLKVWCKADGEITKDGGNNVSAWGESGYLSLTQGTGARQPQWLADGAGGLNAVEFDGTDDVLTGTLALSPPFTVFTVASADVIGSGTIYGHAASSAAATDRAFMIRYEAIDGVQIYVTRSSVNTGKKITEMDTGDYKIRTHEAGSTHATNKYFVGGVEQTTEDLAVGDPGTASLNTTFWLGMYDTIRPFDGKMREVLVYDPSPGPTDVASINSYLTDRWSL